MNRLSTLFSAALAAGSFAFAPSALGHCGACSGEDHAEGEHVCNCEQSGETAAATETGNIVETAAAAGGFETLLAAAQAAGLAETLAEGGPFTVLAPTDEAFAALPEGTVESLLLPENQAQLQQVLLYHVIDGEVLASTVRELDSAPTLQGATVDIQVDGEAIAINGANVIAADVQASNGVIHVIDAVLLPPAETASAE